MGLTQAQRTLIEKARATGSGELGVGLTDEACCFLVGVIARDLGLDDAFPELPGGLPDFFAETHPEDLLVCDLDFESLLERLISLVPDADTYFSCLGTLHKTRLKYARILEYQPIPTMDQVGPRSLLQFGMVSPQALAGFLLWRKWLFDIDNRAGQETGYLFEPIIANSIGGCPVSAKKSPVRRQEDKKKGRQVDCVRKHHAYEIKIRVTIAASGQGRWGEELSFPVDCRLSGYTPVLIVLDPTSNPKLSELADAYAAEDGSVYIGDDAWTHLEEVAGKTMGVFLDRYVRTPIQEVLAATPEDMPSATFSMDDTSFCLSIDGEGYSFRRTARADTNT